MLVAIFLCPLFVFLIRILKHIVVIFIGETLNNKRVIHTNFHLVNTYKQLLTMDQLHMFGTPHNIAVRNRMMNTHRE